MYALLDALKITSIKILQVQMFICSTLFNYSGENCMGINIVKMQCN